MAQGHDFESLTSTMFRPRGSGPAWDGPGRGGPMRGFRPRGRGQNFDPRMSEPSARFNRGGPRGGFFRGPNPGSQHFGFGPDDNFNPGNNFDNFGPGDFGPGDNFGPRGSFGHDARGSGFRPRGRGGNFVPGPGHDTNFGAPRMPAPEFPGPDNQPGGFRGGFGPRGRGRGHHPANDFESHQDDMPKRGRFEFDADPGNFGGETSSNFGGPNRGSGDRGRGRGRGLGPPRGRGDARHQPSPGIPGPSFESQPQANVTSGRYATHSANPAYQIVNRLF